MTQNVSDVAFTSAVKAEQEKRGSRAGYAKMEQKGGWHDRVTPDLAAFIAERDFFYLATASAEGQPYAQHRGGAPGFLKVLDEQTLAFADFRGNRQYITAGNLSENPRAFIFLMDYANRRRIKIWGRARIVEGEAGLLETLVAPDGAGKPDHAVVFVVDAWDVNCPQHITPRYSDAERRDEMARLRGRIAELETQLEGVSAA